MARWTSRLFLSTAASALARLAAAYARYAEALVRGIQASREDVGEWLAANSEYVGRGQPLARLISSARVTQNATALFRAILGYREGTPCRNFEDGVEHS